MTTEIQFIMDNIVYTIDRIVYHHVFMEVFCKVNDKKYSVKYIGSLIENAISLLKEEIRNDQ